MHYTAFRDGKSIGTFSEEQLKSALAAGVLRPSDTYFGEGMPGILPLAQLGRPEPAQMAAVPASGPAPSAPASRPPAGSPAGRPDWDAMPSGPVPVCCSRCQSADIKSAPLVYKMGKSSGSMAGMSLSGDVGIATTQNISSLAEELAPPVKASGALIILFLGLALAVYFGASKQSQGLFIFVALVALAGSIAYAVSASRSFAKAMYLWRNRWICLKCGHKFLSVAPAALAELKGES